MIDVRGQRAVEAAKSYMKICPPVRKGVIRELLALVRRLDARDDRKYRIVTRLTMRIDEAVK